MIKILIVEDHPLFRNGIKLSLSQNEDISVIGEADNKEDAVELVKKDAPDLILMDISLKRSDGLETTKEILEINHDIKIIILSSYTDAHYIKRAIQAGAKGFLPKEILDDNLFDAISKVMNNKLYFDPLISDSFLVSYAKEVQSGSKPIDVLFNPIEKQVFLYLMDGDGMKDMAGKMKVSLAYLSKVRNAIFERAGVTSLVALTKFALKEKLISSDDI
jgi:two-component system, NarL family, invasion response regulator UvrY